MKNFTRFVVRRLITGVIVVAPIASDCTATS